MKIMLGIAMVLVVFSAACPLIVSWCDTDLRSREGKLMVNLSITAAMLGLVFAGAALFFI